MKILLNLWVGVVRRSFLCFFGVIVMSVELGDGYGELGVVLN